MSFSFVPFAFGGSSSSVDLSQQDLLAAALGVQAQTCDPRVCTANTAPTNGSIFGTALWIPAGTFTGIKLRNSTAAAGTLPTGATFGLLDATGKVLAKSANTHTALAEWGTGVLPFAFTGAYTQSVAAAGFGVFIVNGTWGTTQPTPLLASSNGAALAADGANPPPQFVQTGQTDLPAVGVTVPLTGTTPRGYWFGLY